jgi:hypothetical protein
MAFNPGLINQRFIQSLPGREGGDDFQHAWSNNQVEPGGPEGYQEPPWMPDFGANEGRQGETPREREEVRLRAPGGEAGGLPGLDSGGDQPGGMPGGPAGGPQASPAQPRSPASRSGMPGLMPFKPLPTAGQSSQLTSPRLRGLYGSAGGLQGGGLGLPLDPVSNQASDPLELIMSLLKGRG